MNKPSEVDLLGGKRPTFHQNVSRKFWKVLPSTWKYMKVHESTWKYMKVLWSLKMIMIILNSFFYTVESTPEIWWFCTKAWNFDRNSRPRCTTSLKKISRFWGSAHWLAGSARFFLQASRRFPHGLFFAEKRWPKKRAEVVAKWWRNFPKKNPRLAASRSAMESPTERILNLLSANIWLQEISIFRDLSGLFGSLTCIVNHQTLPGSIVSLKAADKIFHCLSRQSRLTLDLEWFLIVSIHVSLMAHVFRVAMCVCVAMRLELEISNPKIGPCASNRQAAYPEYCKMLITHLTDWETRFSNLYQSITFEAKSNFKLFFRRENESQKTLVNFQQDEGKFM